MGIARRGFLKGTGLVALGASGAVSNLRFANAAGGDKHRGIAMTIGLNRVSSSAYPGAPPLRGCVNDAKDIYDIARLQGFECNKPLLDEAATASAVISGIQNAARELKSGDIFLIQYAGHGSQIPDRNGDESDGQDETWCLFDRMLIDDELGRLWTEFSEGVRILMISDSCHSGSVARGRGFVDAVKQGGAGRGDADKERILDELVFRYLPHELPDDVAANSYNQQKTVLDRVADDLGDTSRDEEGIKASVLLISGCQDNQLSGDLKNNGLFTTRLKQVWDDGKFNQGKRPNYRSFHGEILGLMPLTQSPNFYPIGRPNLAFYLQKPFTI